MIAALLLVLIALFCFYMASRGFHVVWPMPSIFDKTDRKQIITTVGIYRISTAYWPNPIADDRITGETVAFLKDTYIELARTVLHEGDSPAISHVEMIRLCKKDLVLALEEVEE